MVSERRRSRLGRGVQEELIKYFCAGVTARAAAEVSGVNRNTAILFYHKLREVIFDALEAEAAINRKLAPQKRGPKGKLGASREVN